MQRSQGVILRLPIDLTGRVFLAAEVNDQTFHDELIHCIELGLAAQASDYNLTWARDALVHKTADLEEPQTDYAQQIAELKALLAMSQGQIEEIPQLLSVIDKLKRVNQDLLDMAASLNLRDT